MQFFHFRSTSQCKCLPMMLMQYPHHAKPPMQTSFCTVSPQGISTTPTQAIYTLSLFHLHLPIPPISRPLKLLPSRRRRAF